MSEFEKSTLSQKIADEIAMRISKGIIQQGERLLENDLMDSFGTSRAPIREALFILEKNGFAERIPRRGVFVKSYSKKELFDLYDTVYRLLEIVVKKIIQNTAENNLTKLSELVKEMEQINQGKKVKLYFELIEQFQLELFDLTGNLVLKDLYMRIQNQLTPFRYMSITHSSSLEMSIEEYIEILAGIKEKDEKVALNGLHKKEMRALSILEKVVEKKNISKVM
ncbi:GntR family transcriptional regulator [Neobacillus niacini]|uniref:GntR family transcriptional regulator n=1 Tax=Neobacillus niacini TaxID=86668 RepID=UPI0005EE0A20|nr:GntR family transcriptional regulator [Neobacillus niacini]